MRTTKSERLTALILRVFQLNGLMLAWGDAFLAPAGLTSARWQMLGALALGDGPASTPQIAEAMGVTRQGAQKQIHLLVQDGLIEAQPNPAHKRSPRYVLTEAGRRVYARVEQQWQAHAEAVAAAFSVADLDTASQVLDAIAAQHARHDEAHA